MTTKVPVTTASTTTALVETLKWLVAHALKHNNPEAARVHFNKLAELKASMA
jgi:hypothetical protein